MSNERVKTANLHVPSNPESVSAGPSGLSDHLKKEAVEAVHPYLDAKTSEYHKFVRGSFNNRATKKYEEKDYSTLSGPVKELLSGA